MVFRDLFLSRFISILMLLSFAVVVVAQDVTSDPEAESRCSLADQIRAQNTGRLIDDCKVLRYNNAFQLHEDIVLTEPLPAITSRLKVDGQGHTISGDGQFRIFEVDGGNLNISDLHMIRGAAFWGSAILADHGASVYLQDSSVKYNEARFGGTINVRFSSLTVTNSEIARNSAGYGGAIESSASAMRIEDSRIANNSAQFGGAIRQIGGSLTLRNTVFANNESEVSGGAIDGTLGGTIQVRNSIFSHNSAQTGGAIYSSDDSSLLTISQSRFSHNVARFSGGAIYMAGSPELYVSDSEFEGNAAGQIGGAIVVKDGAFFIGNSSFRKNISDQGAAFYTDGGSVTILDTAIAENVSAESGEPLHFAESEVRHLDIRED